MQLVRLGISGINIEDADDSFELLLEKIRKIREKLTSEKADIHINFRTDVYLKELVNPENQVAETIRRGNEAKMAGADSLFVPGLTDLQSVKTIASEVALPIHVMAWEGLPNASELSKFGVKRLSDGARIAAVVWKSAAKAAHNFMTTGDSEPLVDGNWELQQLLAD
ncbi:isocitrate lyase/phosphoenolpyruvate mutase family protein [Flavobacterium sp. 3HN19-14]|uniref:isocitrate lyase/phosphoenolpyruvate mutase family protein n=1 Tax=Flavobacterium sp. 3HN19-14 TaxID=3448133 RepID=UPI003EE2C02A